MKYKLLILFLLSFNIAASEIFLECDYDRSDKWIKLSADKNKDNGSLETSWWSPLIQKCDVTFTSSHINWSCRLTSEYSPKFNVNRENLEFDNVDYKLGKCEVVETKNRI